MQDPYLNSPLMLTTTTSLSPQPIPAFVLQQREILAEIERLNTSRKKEEDKSMQLIARLSMVDPKIEMRMKEREEEKASLQLIARMSQLEPEGRGKGFSAADSQDVPAGAG